MPTTSNEDVAGIEIAQRKVRTSTHRRFEKIIKLKKEEESESDFEQEDHVKVVTDGRDIEK